MSGFSNIYNFFTATPQPAVDESDKKEEIISKLDINLEVDDSPAKKNASSGKLLNTSTDVTSNGDISSTASNKDSSNVDTESSKVSTDAGEDSFSRNDSKVNENGGNISGTSSSSSSTAAPATEPAEAVRKPSLSIDVDNCNNKNNTTDSPFKTAKSQFPPSTSTNADSNTKGFTTAKNADSKDEVNEKEEKRIL